MINIPRHVYILVGAVVIASAGFSFWLHDRPRVDAQAYDRIGWNLARGLGYVEDETLSSTPAKDDAVVRVGPGYEFFLGVVYSVFGHRHWIVWVFNAVFRGASVLLLYMVAYYIFSSRAVAFLSASIFGFSPDLIAVNGFLLTETLFILLIIGAVYSSLLYFSGKNSFVLILCNTIWTLAVLTRPVAILAWFIFIVFVILHKEWKKLLLAMIIPILLIGSWSAYISDRYGAFILITTAGWYDLWVGNHLGATGGFDKSHEIQKIRNVSHSVDIVKIAKRKYFEFVKKHPFRFIELQFRKLSIYFNIARPGGFWVGLWRYKFALFSVLFGSLVWNVILFICGLSGAWLVWRNRNDISSRLFLFMAFTMPLGVIPIIVETRYRYPFFPFLAVFAAYFFIHMKLKLAKNVFVVALITLVILSLYDITYNFPSFISKLHMVL